MNKKYHESYKRFQKLEKDNLDSFCLWEIEHENFLLICWPTLDENMSYAIKIFQIWPDGAGYSTYIQE